jgi:prolyl-tRNA synthetase
VPLRLEVGPRDLAQGLVTVVRRDTREKLTVALGDVASTVSSTLAAMQGEMFEGARRFRDEHTRDVATIDEAIEAAQSGFARVAWSQIGAQGEARLKADAVTVRCLQRRDGSIPRDEDEEDLVAVVAKSY